MAAVDFTKDELISELRAVMREDMRVMLDGGFEREREYTQGLLAKEREHTQQMFVKEREHTKGLFVEERKHTREMVGEMVEKSTEDVKMWITGEFMSFIEYTFDPGMESLQEQISELREDMKKHRLVG